MSLMVALIVIVMMIGSNNGARRSSRQSRPPGEWWRASANVVKLPADVEPQTVEQALASDAADLWLQAINEELASLYANNTWTVENVPHGVRPIPCKWVFKIKRDAHGNIERYKARLVVKGFQQIAGVWSWISWMSRLHF